MSGGSHLNEQHRKMLGDQGFFKELSLHPMNWRNASYALLAASAGSNLPHVLATSGAMAIYVPGADTTGTSIILRHGVTLPLDAAFEYTPGPLTSAKLGPWLTFRGYIQKAATTTANTLVVGISGSNHDNGTAISEVTKTFTIAESTDRQLISLDWDGDDFLSSILTPGTDLQITAKFGSEPGATEHMTMTGLKLLYRANAAIKDDQLRQYGKILNSTLKGVN